MAMILKAKINISDDDVKDQYKEFMSIYPDGKISLEEFTEMFGNKVVFSPESIFRYIDKVIDEWYRTCHNCNLN